MNAAHSQLFAFWNGPLFAQDEVQAAEFTPLARLQFLWRKTKRLDVGGDPVLIERVARIHPAKNDRYLEKIYGNQLASYPQSKANELIESKFKLDQADPVYHNILALAAPDMSNSPHKPYKLSELQEFFVTLLTGFMGSARAARKKQLMVAAMNLGAGAFGNNLTVSYILQLLAISMVSQYHAPGALIIPYVFDENGNKCYQEAREWLLEKVKGKEHCTLTDLLEKLESENFKHGASNGT
jgi:hypothetical protein